MIHSLRFEIKKKKKKIVFPYNNIYTFLYIENEKKKFWVHAPCVLWSALLTLPISNLNFAASQRYSDGIVASELK